MRDSGPDRHSFAGSWCRRRFLRLLGLGASAAIFPWQAAAASGNAGNGRVRFGLCRDSFAAWPVITALRDGCFREGIEVEPIFFPHEDETAKALAEGLIDCAALSPPRFFAVHLGLGPWQEKWRPLVCWQVAHIHGSLLLAPRESPVRFSRQLAGKTIALSSPWDMARLLLAGYLRVSGLEMDEYPRLLPLAGKGAETALESGFADAMTIDLRPGYPHLHVGRERILSPLSVVWDDHPGALLAAGRDFQKQHPRIFEVLARGTLQGAWILETAIIAGTGRLGNRFSQVAEENRASARVRFEPFPFQSAGRLILKELKERGVVPETFDEARITQESWLSGGCRKWMGEIGWPAPDDDDREERIAGCCYSPT